ncbi:MAG: MBL fold metallo-hydrolase [Kiritimatiellia bacterium]
MHSISLITCLLVGMAGVAGAQAPFESDVLKTSAGDVTMTFIGHGSLWFAFGGKIIHVDPWGKLADYTRMPKADIILVTHEHQDHLDPATIRALRGSNTVVLLTAACAERLPDGTILKNGDVQTVAGVKIEAVPAYNLVNKREDGQPYHPKGAGNGYLLTFGDQRVYVAGDTENTPEMKALKNIDVAFLPMNLPYTMTPAMVADAVRAFHPKVLYPYHFGETDTSKLTALLKDLPDVEVRIRKMK